MKATSGFGWLGRLLAAAGLFFFPFSARSAQEASAIVRYSTNATDKVRCEHQLNIIYGAIQKYRSDHTNQYPEKLSDLIPDFIHDRSVLVCPFVQNRGGLRIWRKQIRDLSPDSSASYGYEFAPVPMDYNQWRGLPKKTWQDFKQRVADVVGPKVPVVRCQDHRPWLNLAMDGRIYESGHYWEKTLGLDESLMTVAKLFPSPTPARLLAAADFPPRDSRAEAGLLDLSESYNATLTNSWQGFPGNHLASLPRGIQEFDGVRFDIRGVIQLRGGLPAEFPKQVDGIKVDQKCDRIHFLHAASFLYTAGLTNGFYVIHYADGRVQEVPLVHGRQIADWWHDPKSTTAAPTDAKEVWTGENEAAKAYDKVVSLYRFTWDNPWKDTPIATLTFDSGPRKHGPFVVAITLE